MCDANYSLYWWGLEPYAEPAEPDETTIVEKEAFVENQVDGLIMESLHNLFFVRLP